jgi:hypothetical protein
VLLGALGGSIKHEFIFAHFLPLFNYFSSFLIKTHLKPTTFLTLFDGICRFLATFCQKSSLFRARLRADFDIFQRTCATPVNPS